MNMPKLPNENMFVSSVVEEVDPILQTINATNESAWLIESD